MVTMRNGILESTVASSDREHLWTFKFLFQLEERHSCLLPIRADEEGKAEPRGTCDREGTCQVGLWLGVSSPTHKLEIKPIMRVNFEN